MDKLYRKSEIWFAVCWIIVYVAGTGAADSISSSLGIEKALTLPWLLFLSGTALFWLHKNGLWQKYGLCRPAVPAGKLLWYLPLVLIVSCNFWFGLEMRLSVAETVLYTASMLLVGFLEELIFRGFLFKAMARDGLRSAVIVSSLTFGAGHIVNLLNGAEPLPTICQIVYAAAAGFAFVALFLRTGSILSCIITHSFLNASSVFAVSPDHGQLLTAAVLTLSAGGYALFLMTKLRPIDGSPPSVVQ